MPIGPVEAAVARLRAEVYLAAHVDKPGGEQPQTTTGTPKSRATARESGTTVATLTTHLPNGESLKSFMVSCGCSYISGPYVTPWLVRMIVGEHEASCRLRSLWGL